MTTAVLTIAQRDVTKLLRDRQRLFMDLMFPILIVLFLGGTLNLSIGGGLRYDFLVFVFTGAFAQSMFQSAGMGMVFLAEDRDNDFSQEVFVSPISRYTIVVGKILGEALVALPQGFATLLVVFAYGLLTQGDLLVSPQQLLGLALVALPCAFFGGAFGLAVLAGLGSRRAANQVFQFVMLPQYFLAGVFVPVAGVPGWFDAISRLAPMRYAVDLTRNVFYAGRPEYERVVLDPALFDIGMMAMLFVLFLPIGTFLFVRAERNR